MSDYAIVIVCYNRLDSVKRLYKSLEQAEYKEKVTLIFSIDNSGNEDIEIFAKSINWNHGELVIIKHKERLGLRNHVLYCGNLTKTYENLIVLEDDIMVSRNFMNFVVSSCESYKNDENIAGISLYLPSLNQQGMLPFEPLIMGGDTFFMQYAQSWGQIWTRDKWQLFYKWYEKNKNLNFSEIHEIPSNVSSWSNKSWLKYHIAYCILENKYFVYPFISHTTNFTEIGEHNRSSNPLFQVSLDERLNYTYNCTEWTAQEKSVYDAFFEFKDLTGEYEFDLYNNKTRIRKNCKLVTQTKIPEKKVLYEYGLTARPHEFNVIRKIEGQGIYIYKIEDMKIMDSPKSGINSQYYFKIIQKRTMYYILKDFVKNLFLKRFEK